MDITVCASKTQPHAWVPTYIQTHKVPVYTAQPDRQYRIYPQVRHSGYSDVCGHKKNQGQLKPMIHSSRLELRPWSTHVALVQLHELNTVLNISQTHSKHKWRGTASSLHKKEGPTWDCGKDREPCQTRVVWCVQCMTVRKIPLFHFQQHPVVLKRQLSAGKKRGEVGCSEVPLAQWFSSRINVTDLEEVFGPSARERSCCFLAAKAVTRATFNQPAEFHGTRTPGWGFVAR